MVNPEMIHLMAGGIGGTVAALITCPLEVIKVRLQSTDSRVTNLLNIPTSVPSYQTKWSFIGRFHNSYRHSNRIGIWKSIRLIVMSEGKEGLYKGVGPTLFGVIPSRSVYFSSYYHAQLFFNEYFTPDSSAVFFCSAALSSAISSTITNPIWYIKTRLQLDFGTGNKKLTVWKIIRNTYKDKGIPGFYRGVTASYAGISETGINFMIYEKLKMFLLTKFHESDNVNTNQSSKLYNFSDTLLCMAASILSKTFATTVAYPHEVARTRLREEGDKYRGFFQTISLVYKEESIYGLYRGIVTHYMRQVPNTCIIMGVYEGIVLFFEKWGINDDSCKIDE